MNKFYPNIVKWNGFKMIGSNGYQSSVGDVACTGLSEIGQPLAYIYIESKKFQNQYKIKCLASLKGFHCNNKVFETGDLAMQAIENEIISKNRKIKINNILKELNE